MADCPTCDKIAYFSIGWQRALDGKGSDPEPAAIARNLQHRRALKFGQLYQCRNCNLYWFLDDDNLNMHRVPRDKTESLFDWANCQLMPTNHIVSQFHEIGATGPDQYGNGAGEIKIPCSVETKSGDSHERAVVLITKMPPIAYWQKSTTLGNDVTVFTRSDFALPLDVRLATLNANEVSMGFAPTRVQAKDGRYFILNGSPNFFSYGTLKGCDISLCPVAFRHTNDIPIISEDLDRITWIHYDWFPGCESLTQNLT